MSGTTASESTHREISRQQAHPCASLRDSARRQRNSNPEHRISRARSIFAAANSSIEKMTSSKATIRFIVGLLVLFAGLSTQATWAQSGRENSRHDREEESQDARFRPPYPFSSDELMGKLLRVLILPEGHVTREQAEAAFGIRIPKEREIFFNEPRQPGVHYLAKAGEDWYFSVGVIEGIGEKSLSIFSLQMGRSGIEDSSACLSEKMMSTALAQSGWILEEAPTIQQGLLGSFKRYSKEKFGKAILTFATQGPVTSIEEFGIYNDRRFSLGESIQYHSKSKS